MCPWPAIISKSQTDDGHWVLLPDGHYKVGDEIQVDADSRSVREFKVGEETVLCEVVELVSPQTPKVLFPVEILSGL